MIRIEDYDVLVACEESGMVRDALINVGVRAMSCDLKPTRRPGPHYQGSLCLRAVDSVAPLAGQTHNPGRPLAGFNDDFAVCPTPGNERMSGVPSIRARYGQMKNVAKRARSRTPRSTINVSTMPIAWLASFYSSACWRFRR
jgi:hypothetical protein